MTPDLVTRDNIRDFLQFVFRPGDLIEIRGLIPSAKPMRGLFNDFEMAANFALAINRDYGANVYFGINPVSPTSRYGTLSALNKGIRQASMGARGPDIARRQLYLLDFDPVRESGTPSTDEQKAAAFAMAEGVRKYLTSLGWPSDPLMVDSGNGIHLYYLADGCGPDGSILRFALKHLDEMFSTAEVHIDKSVFKPAQLSRMPYTWNRKGDNTPERPHRQSNVLHYPASWEPVPSHRIYHLGVKGGFISEYAQQPGKSTGDAPELVIDEEGVCQLITEFPEVLSLSRVTHDGDRTYFALAECPFAGRAHIGGGGQQVGRGKSTIMLGPDYIGFSCLSDDCSHFTFGDLLRHLHSQTGLRPSMPIYAERTLDEIEDLADRWGCDLEDMFVTEFVEENTEKEELTMQQTATAREAHPEALHWAVGHNPEIVDLTFERIEVEIRQKAQQEDAAIAQWTVDAGKQRAFRSEVERIIEERDIHAAANYLGRWTIERLRGLRGPEVGVEEFRAVMG
jgi:hypothetical protein